MFKHGITVKVILKSLQKLVQKAPACLLLSFYSFYFQNYLSIFICGYEMLCACMYVSDDKSSRKADLFCSLYIHTTQRFRSLALCWSECDFCFSRKGHLRCGRWENDIVYSIDSAECVWLQAGLAEGTAACWGLVWTAMAWPFSPAPWVFGGLLKQRELLDPVLWMSQPSHASSFLSSQCFWSSLPYCS